MAFLLQLANSFAEPLVLAGFGVAIAITALSYMAGEFFSMPSLKAFSKLELRELGVTAVIILLLFGLDMRGGVYDQVAQGIAAKADGTLRLDYCQEWIDLYGPVQGNHYEKGNYAFAQAGYFLGCRLTFGQIASFMSFDQIGTGPQGVLMPELMGFYRQFMIYEMLTGIGSTFTLGLELPELLQAVFKVDVHLSNIVPFIFLGPINEAHTLLVDIIGTLVSATAAQHMLLAFIEINVPKVILPLGIAMRAFPFTRKAGSTIVAFAFVAYFIYPLSILVNERIYDGVAHTKCEPNSNKLEDGDTCSYDAQCCSGNCIASQCRPMLGDFDKFASTYAICGVPLEQSQQVQQSVDDKLRQGYELEVEYQRKVKELNEKTTAPTKASGRIVEKDAEDTERTQLRKEYGQNGMDSVFITPSAAWSLMWQFEYMVSDTGRLLVLHSIFIVTEILLTLTILKDISLLIGGEPRLLGISKLV